MLYWHEYDLEKSKEDLPNFAPYPSNFFMLILAYNSSCFRNRSHSRKHFTVAILKIYNLSLKSIEPCR